MVPGQSVNVNFTKLPSGDIRSGAPVGYPFSGYIWLGYCTDTCTAPTGFVQVATINAKNSGGTFAGSTTTISGYPSSSTTSSTSSSTTSSSTTSIIPTQYISSNTVLSSDIIANENLVVNSIATLTTNSHYIIISGTLTNNGIISSGNLTNGGKDNNAGTISYAMNAPLSYGGSGGGGGWSDCNGGTQGGNTIAPGGLSAGEQESGCTSYDPLPGTSPAAPTPSYVLSNIKTWYNNGLGNYLNGAGGGTVAGGTCGGSATVTGGNGAFGIYLQANSIDNAGTINADGSSGNDGTGGSGCWDAGGGGGSFVILAYQSTINVGVIDVSGGGWVGNDGCCGNGGDGNYIEVQYTTPPITP